MSDSDSDIYIEDDSSYDEAEDAVQQPLLRPTTKLRRMYDGREIHPFNEYQLNRSPVSLRELVGCLQDSAHDWYNPYRYIWINEESLIRFVHQHQFHHFDAMFPFSLSRVIFRVEFETLEEEEIRIEVRGTYEKAVAEFFRLIAQFASNDFLGKGLSIVSSSSHESRGNGSLQKTSACPLLMDDLSVLQRNMLDKPLLFSSCHFQPEQACALFGLPLSDSMETPSSLHLNGCHFTDGGALVIERLKSHVGNSTLFQGLVIGACQPFDEEQMVDFLTVLSARPSLVETLTIRQPSPLDDSWKASENLGSISVKNLILSGSNFPDVAKDSLIDAIETGSGPRGLHINGFRNILQWRAFARAIGSEDCVLARLTLYEWEWNTDASVNEQRQLRQKLLSIVAEGLQQNKSLKDIDFAFQMVFEGDLEPIFNAVETHKSLVKLTLTDLQRGGATLPNDPDTLQLKVPRTIALGRMLEVNRMIHDVYMDESMYDRFVWKKAVEPMKERNGVLVLMKRFHTIQSQMDRAFFLPTLLEKRSSSVIYMLLKMNSDVLSIYGNAREGKEITLDGEQLLAGTSPDRPADFDNPVIKLDVLET